VNFGSAEAAMSRAIELAFRGQGRVEPNPMVGAVIVDDSGELLGEGYHRKYGGPHAEVFALEQAGEKACGGTLYVTLEPCSHHGKTPPCADTVIKACLKKVYVGMVDPNPEVSGRGIEKLKEAGIDVHVGMLSEQCQRLTEPFVKLMTHHRPYVIVKWAMTIDGKIARWNGDSKWISNAQSRARVHQLRSRVDAVMTGVGTVKSDDPLLNARLENDEKPLRVATRIVVDSRSDIELTSKLVQTAREIPLLVATTHAMDASKVTALKAAGVEVLILPANEYRRVDLHALLDELGRRRMTNILVEAGPGLVGGLWDAREIDEVQVFLAPKIIADDQGYGPVGGPGETPMSEAGVMDLAAVEPIGNDVWMRYVRVHHEPQS
jgi:diaminohydroxyphosphoribosylaminopyrimidine deaminase/5-amino-6-(5-phosphoribosylamino)uracil reductase